MSETEPALVRLAPRAVAAASSLAERTLAERERRTVATAVRTLLVDPAISTCYSTISGAVDGARPGDRVLVRPGRYRESVRIAQAIDVRGQGDRETIVVEGTEGPAFVVSADGVHLAGLTCEGGREFDDEADEVRLRSRSAGVLLINCDAVVEGLLIQNTRGDGIDIGGGSSTVRQNTVRGAVGHGVAIWGGATCLIEGNDIADSAVGITIGQGGTAPVVKANTVHDNEHVGIVVMGGASPIVEDNEVSGNGRSGIAISGTATAPLVLANTVQTNAGEGIRVIGAATPTISRNLVGGNESHGIVVIGAGTAPLVRNNWVHGNSGDGIKVTDAATPTIELNEITENEWIGVRIIGAGSSALVDGNSVRDNGLTGIWADPHATATVRSNNVVRKANARRARGKRKH